MTIIEMPSRAGDDRVAQILCQLCGNTYDVKARRAREIQNAERRGKGRRVCPNCRRAEMFGEVRASPEDLQFWREVWTTEQLMEVAQMIWGPVDRWPEVRARRAHRDMVLVAEVASAYVIELGDLRRHRAASEDRTNGAEEVLPQSDAA